MHASGTSDNKGFRTVCNSGVLSKVYTIERNSEFRHDPSRLMKSFFVSCGIRVAVSRPGLDHTLDPKHEIRTAASDRHTCLDDSEGWICSSSVKMHGYAEAETSRPGRSRRQQILAGIAPACSCRLKETTGVARTRTACRCCQFRCQAKMSALDRQKGSRCAASLLQPTAP